MAATWETSERALGSDPAANADTRDKLDKRYKNLAKTYHPDMDSGDTETMALINQEYERLKDFLGQ